MWPPLRSAAEKNLAQTLRFILVGASNTIFYFLTANALHYVLGVERDISSYVSYGLVLPLSFLGHRKFTFRSSSPPLSEWLRFCVMQALCLCIIGGVNAAANSYPAFPTWLSFAAISILIPALSFVIMQLWVFAARRPRR
ncbi:GtrA family protein [Neorhizobium huautlense]|uniref:GtrA family protein n=1 Tax=Neorhizobium huautlense TaxID=67774 RepID=UPI00359344B5